MKLVKKLSVIFDNTLNLMAVLAGILLIFLVFSISAEITMRYFLNQPLGWVVEISEYSLLYITFLVAAWVLRKEGHISMDIVLVRLSPRRRSLINAATGTVSAILCLVLTWFAVRITWQLYEANYFSVPSLLYLPKFIFTAIIVIGSFFLFIQFARRTREYLRSWRAPQDKEPESAGNHKSEL